MISFLSNSGVYMLGQEFWSISLLGNSVFIDTSGHNGVWRMIDVRYLRVGYSYIRLSISAL
jgi:hypothetical protein